MEWAIAVGIVIGIACVVIAIVTAILKVVWHASGNLFDWLVYTFGNDEAVRDLKRRKGWE